MKHFVNSILEKVPNDIRFTANEYFSEHLSIFEPKQYVIGKKVCLDHYHFVIFIKKPPLLRIGKKEYQFQKGSLIFLTPGMELSVSPFTGNIAANYLSISISEEFFNKIAIEALEGKKINLIQLENLYSCTLYDLIMSFKEEFHHYGNRFPMMLNSLATQIAFQLLRDVVVDSHIHRKNGSNDQKYIQKALIYMENHFDCNITLQEISQEIYVSQAHFERMFKYHLGQTPHQFLIKIRIQKAKDMLADRELTIEEIANKCGFISLSHFSTVFKRMTGVTPSFYRNLVSS